MKALVPLISALAITGCATLRGYEGPSQPRHEVAIIRGDYRFNAGAPLTIILRAVDGRVLEARYNAVEVLPGKHVFVVDCMLRETRSHSRHEVVAEVESGMRYGFTAEIVPGMRGCASVEVEPRN